MSLVKVRPKNQITIPATVARACEIKAGDIVDVSDVDGKAIITRKRVITKTQRTKKEI